MKLSEFRERFFAGAPRYRWLADVGRGGMGIVFQATDLELGEEVAIKVLSPELEDRGHELLTRFKNEISLNRKIKHPNVARIHDFGLSGEYPFITMEFVAGKDLRTVIQEKGRLTAGEAVAIVRQIALGTHAAHKLGIVHRDLKSQNIMVDDGGAIAILDFGLARKALSDKLTMASTMLGTPQYMSPEQAMGEEADARSDIYSIGIILYECLTGDVPFKSDSPIATALMHVTEMVPTYPLDEARVPLGLQLVVHKAVEKHPQDRYATAEELEAELSKLGRLDAVKARPSDAAFPVPGSTPGVPGVESIGSATLPPISGPMSVGFEPPRPAETISIPLPPPPAPSHPAPAPGLGGSVVDQEPFQVGETRDEGPDKPPPTLVHRHNPVVVVVEDEAADRKAFAQAIRDAGCQAMEAASGQEVLEVLMHTTPDLVLMDVSLPGMDGFDVSRIIRSQPSFAQLPIVLTSPKMQRGQLAFGIQSGATDFITKPIAPATLAWRIWKVLRTLGYVHPAEREAAKESMRMQLGLRDPDLKG